MVVAVLLQLVGAAGIAVGTYFWGGLYPLIVALGVLVLVAGWSLERDSR